MARRWLEALLLSHWYRPRRSLLAWLLMPLSGLVVMYLRWRPAPTPHDLRAPLLVVGNLTVGGTGKTPLTRALVDALRDRGWSPGVISRGYGGQARQPCAVQLGDDPRWVGDEPLILAQAGVPVWIGRDRVAAGKALLANHPEVDLLICDDGLQHRALRPCVSVAVVDGRRGWGNGALLPAGPLREPLTRLTSLDAVVINRGFAGDPYDVPAGVGLHTLMTLEALSWVNLAEQTEVSLMHFADQACVALAGIGHPARFFEALPRWGIVAETFTFPDHYDYRLSDLPDRRGRPLLMTEKDAIKWQRWGLTGAWYLRVGARVEPSLTEHLVSRLVTKESHG